MVSLQSLSNIAFDQSACEKLLSCFKKQFWTHKVQKMFRMNQNFLFYKPNYYFDLDWIDNLFQNNFCIKTTSKHASYRRLMLDKTFLLCL